MKLSEARDAFLKCQLFLDSKENQDNPDARPLLPQMGNMVRVVESTIISSRTVQSYIKNVLRPVPPADGA